MQPTYLAGMILLAVSFSAHAQPMQHSGLLHTKEQLAVVKDRIKKGEEPWKTAFEKMKKSPQSSLSYNPKPRANVECGGHNNPNHGCDDMTQDARTAYTHALHWMLTDNQAHADKAIQILNAWANVHKMNTNSNAPLVVGWAGPPFIYAAELLRYSNSGWKQDDIKKFENYIRSVYIPVTDNRTPPAPNWMFSILEVRMAVAVFTDDRKLWDESLETWRYRIKTSIYQKVDGPEPIRFGEKSDAFMDKWWWGAFKHKVWYEGMAQETCRDMPHNQLGLYGMTATAEIAWHQGVKLYEEEKKRLADFMEFHAKILMGDARPAGLCPVPKATSIQNTWEIGYNHLVNVLGMNLPNSLRVIKKIRPTNSERHMWKWESLTHAEVGKYAASLPNAIPRNAYTQGSSLVDWKNSRIDLYDLSGTVRHSFQVMTPTAVNSRIELPLGLYLARIRAGDKTMTKLVTLTSNNQKELESALFGAE